MIGNWLLIDWLMIDCRQLFIMSDALPEPSLNRINRIVHSAVVMCSVIYVSVGYYSPWFLSFLTSSARIDIESSKSEWNLKCRVQSADKRIWKLAENSIVGHFSKSCLICIDQWGFYHRQHAPRCWATLRHLFTFYHRSAALATLHSVMTTSVEIYSWTLVQRSSAKQLSSDSLWARSSAFRWSSFHVEPVSTLFSLFEWVPSQAKSSFIL